MTHFKFFLDTNALIYLAGLKDSDLQDFKTRIEVSNLELSTTQIQMDEWKLRKVRAHDYRQKIKEALESLKNKGITVKVEPTKGFVIGESRIGFGRIMGNKETEEVYDELLKEIDKCEKTSRRTKAPSNIRRDALIALSSLGHDFFITCDKCLSESWRKVVGKHRILSQKFKVPKVICARRNPNAVAKRILELLS